MFDPKSTRKKNMRGGFLAMIFCAIVIASTIGSSFGIRNSFAQTQQQVQTQQAPTIAYNSPWTVHTINPNINNFHVLCGHGICDQSSGLSNRRHDNAVLGSPWLLGSLPAINKEEMKSMLD